MKHTKRKITKIVDEMITFFYSVGATRIETTLIQESDAHTIIIRGNYDPSEVETLRQLGPKLNQERNLEYEEMYWNLTGMSHLEDEVELHLVSSLVDSATVLIEPDYCQVTLIRKRNVIKSR